MSDGANYIGTPQRRKVVRRPRVFLLEDGSHMVSATRDSSESMIGTEVSSVTDNSVVTSKRIVQELTENLEEIMQEAEEEITPQADTETSSLPTRQRITVQEGESHEIRQTKDGENMSDEEEEEDCLPVYEGTNPICCATDVSPEFMNRFVELNKTGNNMFYMLFVDSLEDYYQGEFETPVGPEPRYQTTSSTESPFKGKTPHECYLLLRQLVTDTESEIDWQEFVIVDERSLQDDTVILACAPDEEEGEDEVVWVRAAMGIAAFVFSVTMSGKMGLDDIIAEVHEEQGIGGVLRTFP